MTLDEITIQGINPALELLPARMDKPEARVMLLAIGLQESRFIHRQQIVEVTDDDGNTTLQPVGPAKSFWQGERTGGMVRGVRTHPGTGGYAASLYRARGVAANDLAIWSAIEFDDVLAAGLARLLLWSDPFRLPDLGDVDGAYDLYIRTWRPGQPHRATWDAFYAQALDFVTSVEA